MVFEGIKRIINDTTAHSEGYFVGRMFVDGLSRFETVKNKDEKGRLDEDVFTKMSISDDLVQKIKKRRVIYGKRK